MSQALTRRTLAPMSLREQHVTRDLCAQLELTLIGMTPTMAYIAPENDFPGAVLDNKQSFRPFVREHDAKVALLRWCSLANRFASYETTNNYVTTKIGASPRLMQDSLGGEHLAETLCRVILHDKTP